MARVEMYTTAWCGYCVRAKALLDSRGIAYEEINLDGDPHFRHTLLDRTGGWTVPQIVIDGEPIGGRLLDRRSAARARLASTSVDVELELHAAGAAVGCPVVTERRALPGDAGGERL